MQLKLSSTKAVKIELNPYEHDEDQTGEGFEFSFDYNCHVFPKEVNEKRFSISFIGDVKSPEEGFGCKVAYMADFSSDEELPENFITSPFALINAPAIAYPFFRAFLANLMLNAGYKPTLLPSINFVKLAEEKRRDKVSEQEIGSEE
jgi:preprotein translocase subunit SecB